MSFITSWMFCFIQTDELMWETDVWIIKHKFSWYIVCLCLCWKPWGLICACADLSQEFGNWSYKVSCCCSLQELLHPPLGVMAHVVAVVDDQHVHHRRVLQPREQLRSQQEVLGAGLLVGGPDHHVHQQSYPNYQPTWQDVLTSSSKTRFSLAASIPWLISSTQRKGTVVNCWRASMYKAVATLLSPPDYGSSCLVSLTKYFVILYLVVGGQPLQGLSVPVLHHDVHTIVFEVILKLALVQDHLKNDKRS